VEELIVAPLWWMSAFAPTWPGPLVLPLAVSLPVYLCGFALVLGARRRLPEWMFPVRGAWLRRLFVVFGAAALFLAGPWIVLLATAWESSWPLGALTFADYTLYLWAVVRMLSPRLA
jgi:hypothetical protein